MTSDQTDSQHDDTSSVPDFEARTSSARLSSKIAEDSRSYSSPLRPWVVLSLFVLLMIALAPFIYRGYNLSRIPDGPEPFDFAEFRSRSVPDDQNAMIEYAKIMDHSVLSESPYDEPDFANQNFEDRDRFHALLQGDYAGASDQHREWVTRCEEVLDIWYADTVKDSISHVEIPDAVYRDFISFIGEVSRACKARIGRELFHGHSEEAVRWNLALFRFTRHCTQFAGIDERIHSAAIHGNAATLLIHVLNKSELPVDVVEKLTASVVTDFRTMTAQASENVRFDCLVTEEILSESEWLDHIASEELANRLKFWLLGEPVLSRRFSRMMTVNVLQHCDEPRRRRPPIIKYGAFDIPARSSQELSGYEIENVRNQARLLNAIYSGGNGGAGWLSAVDYERLDQSLLVAALHVHVFTRRHGRLPMLLVECVPEILHDELIDPFSPTGASVELINEGNRVIVYSRADSSDDVSNFEVQSHGSLHSSHSGGRGLQIVMPGDLESLRPASK